jgi:DnaK suppressor protein
MQAGDSLAAVGMPSCRFERALTLVRDSTESAMSLSIGQESVRSRDGDRRQKLVECLPAMRKALECERAFRVEQLTGHTIGTWGGSARVEREPGGAEGALHEVDALIVAGARQALADIEGALGAIRAGQYGRCEDCGDAIPFAVLRAVPQSRRCVECHRAPGEPTGADAGGDGVDQVVAGGLGQIT